MEDLDSFMDDDVDDKDEIDHDVEVEIDIGKGYKGRRGEDIWEHEFPTYKPIVEPSIGPRLGVLENSKDVPSVKSMFAIFGVI